MRALRFYCSPVLWARANWFSGVNALLDSSLFYLFKKKFFCYTSGRPAALKERSNQNRQFARLIRHFKLLLFL